METNVCTTSWRSGKVVPTSYDDLRAVCALARRARNGVADFDWYFTHDELVRLREAAHAWGRGVVGRFKAFDARVLAAVNDGLREPLSSLVLAEPSNAAGYDARVSCVPSGDGFRLHGHATFDVIFGYGFAGFTDDHGIRARLGTSLPDKLAKAVGTLGWDLVKLAEPPMRPVVRTIYGLPPAGPGAVEESREPERALSIKFIGPFGATTAAGAPSLFASSLASKNGVYLWTFFDGSSERVWYVGQTRRAFEERMGEHIACFLSGEYSLPDPDSLLEGKPEQSWPPAGVAWPRSLPSFLDAFEEQSKRAISLVRRLRFHFATLDDVPHIHDRAEGAIGRHFRDHPEETIRRTVMSGLRLPAALPGEAPLRLTVEAEANVLGLPTILSRKA